MTSKVNAPAKSTAEAGCALQIKTIASDGFHTASGSTMPKQLLVATV
eukprot:CAMPEP_0172745422 /NCGR_PEP_ID=MMETSP1074-20121228/137871_1 /TAXON_ID=2916 /ORGANISM="Ceratium fusus, Strain PA161109" /LENGTH=46 /DNA_ID= /DNA_START= /DNA_END= /DNA_ORIENTATION=